MVQLKLYDDSLLQVALVLLAIKNDGVILGEREIEGTTCLESLLLRIVKVVIFQHGLKYPWQHRTFSFLKHARELRIISSKKLKTVWYVDEHNNNTCLFGSLGTAPKP